GRLQCPAPRAADRMQAPLLATVEFSSAGACRYPGRPGRVASMTIPALEEVPAEKVAEQKDSASRRARLRRAPSESVERGACSSSSGSHRHGIHSSMMKDAPRVKLPARTTWTYVKKPRACRKVPESICSKTPAGRFCMSER